jgi:hypothetical protein
MDPRSFSKRALAVIFTGLLLMTSAQDAAAGLEPAAPLPQARQRLMILRDTGVVRNGLPVLEEHGTNEEVVRALGRGFASTMVDLYALEQTYLHRKGGPTPEPAYLLLSQNEGGFPRFGFFLGDTDKSGVGFVDLHEGQRIAGRFGALDQIFPHELAHVILHQLAGPPPPGGSNQIHAVGLRTDPGYAFDEGFAEHFQIIVIDDPDVDPWTRALTFDIGLGSVAYLTLAAYKHEMSAPWSLLTRRRMTFPLWYSGTEQVLRYHAVKANVFARAPQIPDHLLRGDDPYRAYLLDNILPGDPEDPPKPFRRMIATEGVIASFFYEWTTNETLLDNYREEGFYQQFGTAAEDIGPLENLYLKLFHVFYERKPHDVLEVIAGYQEIFPDEAAAVDQVARAAFLGQEMVDVPQIWLANPDFQTGTSLFDQFRGMPRTHTFDLNAASVVDLISVPGVDWVLADMIQYQSPYASIGDLAEVPGVTPEVADRFVDMRRAMESLSSSTEDMESGLSLNDILKPYYQRLIRFLIPAALLAAMLYWLARFAFDSGDVLPRPFWLRILLNGVAATLLGLLGAASWASAPFLLAMLSVVAWLGLPAAAWAFWTTGDLRQSAAVLVAWLAAALPVAVVLTPLP